MEEYLISMAVIVFFILLAFGIGYWAGRTE
jgi:hypothetical protein